MRPHSTYSIRAKLGLITLPTNTVNEAEWARMMPQGVTMHAHRMALHPPATSEQARADLIQDIAASVSMLAQADVDVVAYACTAGSMVTPARSLPDAIAMQTGRNVTTTASAILAALSRLGVNRVCVATPYHQALNDHETHFLADHGIEVLAIEGLGLGANGPKEYPLIARTPLETVQELSQRVLRDRAEALLITCTDFPSLPLIPALEERTGLPVISSNTATFWDCLRRAGIGDDIAQAGRLFKFKDLK